MRATFHTELGELMTDLANIIGLAGQMMTNAAIALHQTDLALAGVVIAKCDQMTASLDNMEQHCAVLLARQATVAADLRAVAAAVHVVGHVKRMADLARHIAIIPQLKHPNPMISSPARPVSARMSLLASQLAGDAATAIEHRDPLAGDRLAEADEDVDTLRRHLSASCSLRTGPTAWNRQLMPPSSAATTSASLTTQWPSHGKCAI